MCVFVLNLKILYSCFSLKENLARLQKELAYKDEKLKRLGGGCADKHHPSIDYYVHVNDCLGRHTLVTVHASHVFVFSGLPIVLCQKISITPSPPQGNHCF